MGTLYDVYMGATIVLFGGASIYVVGRYHAQNRQQRMYNRLILCEEHKTSKQNKLETEVKK